MAVRDDVRRREALAQNTAIHPERKEFYRQINLYMKRQSSTTLGLPTTSTSTTTTTTTTA